MSRVARATVDLSALRHNLALVRRAAPRSRVLSVLKAHAYGHGLMPVAQALAADSDGFAVACLEEALPLREAGHRHRMLLLEGAFSADEIAVAAAQRLDLVVHSSWQLAQLARHPPDAVVDVWVKVNTGMNRLGFAADEVAAVTAQLQRMPGVGRIRHMTHLASADDRNDPVLTPRQLATFDAATAGFDGERSAANSAAALGWPAAQLDWVRPGICLYGASPFIDDAPRPALRPAMTLEARLIATRWQRAGDAIGYGGTFACPEDMPVGIASIGYGDGYPRHAPGGTPVLVGGRRAAVVGRVSMDMIAVDLRGHPRAAVGDPVVLWGEGLPAEEVAGHCGTIAYELFCRLTRRVQFHYVDGSGHGEA
jgi:alanine racemase